MLVSVRLPVTKMASGDPRINLEVKPHHEQRRICASRAKYREGRKPRAVKVYTINLESRYLLVQGVPAIGVMKELVEQFALYGAIEEYNVLDEYPTEEFTEVYLIKFQRLQSARVAKRKLDERSFFGGLLHICYAPEFESVQETREKLQERRRYVARATSEKDQQVSSKRQEESESSNSSSVILTTNHARVSSCHPPVESGDPSASFCAPPTPVTPDHRHEDCLPPLSVTSGHRYENYPPPPYLAPYHRYENYPPPSSVTQNQTHETYHPPPSVNPGHRYDNYPPPPSVTPGQIYENYPPPPYVGPNHKYENYPPPPSVTPGHRYENYPPPPSVTPGHIYENYPPPPSVTPGHRYENYPPLPYVAPNHKHNCPPPSPVTPGHKQDCCLPLHSSAKHKMNDGDNHSGSQTGPAQSQSIIASSARFMPRTTQLQERQRRREEETKLTLLPPESQDIIVGPKLPEIPKLDLADHSLNISADIIRTKLKEVSASCIQAEPLSEGSQTAPPVKQRRRI